MSDPTQEELQEVQRQTALIRDQNNTDQIQANQSISVLNAKIEQAQTDLDNLEQKFTNAFAARLQLLKDREDKLVSDQAECNQVKRTLGIQQDSLDELTSSTMVKNQEILDKIIVAIAKNKTALFNINEAQGILNQQNIDYQNAIANLALDKASVLTKQAQADEKVQDAQDLMDQANKLKNDAENATMEAQNTIQQAIDKHNEISGLIADLNAKQVVNEKALSDIQAAKDDLVAQQNKLHALVDQQNANLITIQHVSERNQSQAIALRSQEITVNQMQRDLDIREANVKALEANVKL